jgi:hypothetical protein
MLIIGRLRCMLSSNVAHASRLRRGMMGVSRLLAIYRSWANSVAAVWTADYLNFGAHSAATALTSTLRQS